MSRSCLIVGAGMAGLTAAGEPRARDWKVRLLDKGRGVGGRMATRRTGDHTFDHGAQFFTTRSAAFREAAARWAESGWIAPWYVEGGHTRYLAPEGMSALAKRLAGPHDVQPGTRVMGLEAAGSRWRATAESGESWEADALILTAPAPQAAALPGDLAPSVTAELADIAYDPCFALMVAPDGPSQVPAPGFVRPDAGPIEWIADNRQKGVSGGAGAALTIHARAGFSREYFEAPAEEVTALLLAAVAPYVSGRVGGSQLHRWRYAKAVRDKLSMCLFAAAPAPVAVAGDALAGSKVEGAFLSGLAAAIRVDEANS